MVLRIPGGKEEKGHENQLIPKDSGASSNGAINNAEKNPEQNKKTAVDALEEDLVKGGLHALSGPSGGAYSVMRYFLSNNKRKMTASGLAVTIIISLLFFFSVGQGPLQLVHLSQILQKFSFGQEKTNSIRFRGFIRYFRTGDIGEIRLGHFASKSVRKAIGQLSKIGIDFERNSISGAPYKMTIDTNKHPDFKNLPENKRLSAVRSHFGIVNANIARKAGSIVSIDIDSTTLRGIKFGNSLMRTAIGGLEKGTILAALLKRRMAKFFNLPRLYSPIIAAINKAAEKLRTKRARINAEKERASPRKESTNTRAGPIKSRLRPKLSPKATKIAGGALVGTGVLCMFRDIADDAVALNYAAVVVPSMLEAEDKTAVGAQVQAGQNITLDQAGNVVESFTDENGESIWASKALDAAATNGPGTGKDIPAEYQQAFSNKTTADNIKNTLGAGGVTDRICSKPGQIISIGAGLALIVSGPFTGGLTWGVFAGRATAGAAATAGIMYFLQKTVAPILADSPLVDLPLGGALGGSMMAYGAKASNGLSSRTSGGVALSSEESQALLDEQEEIEKEEFQSKSFFARMFDTQDYRSFASSALRPVYSLSFSQKITKSFSVLTQAPSLFSNTFSGVLSFFTPKSFAQEKQYVWGFPEYGIPAEIINDPRLQDPYENAKVVARKLENNKLDNEVDRAEKCFGVKIEDGPNGWDVLAEKDTNPADKKYIDANCDDLSNFDWKRMILFVHDSQLMTAIACYDGEEEACSDITSGPGETGGGAASPSEEPEIPEKTNCEVDFSAAPGLENLAQFIDRECEVNLPVIEDLMGRPSPFDPPYKIKIVEPEDMAQVGGGAALGQVFTRPDQGGEVGLMLLNKDFLRQNAANRNNARGLLIHELTHVAQGYGTKPGDEKLEDMLGDLSGDGIYQFVTEGGADYIATTFRGVGYHSKEQRLHCMSRGWRVYTSGYSCGGALLSFITEKYSRNLIKKLNRTIRSGQYTDSFFNDLTGKDLNALFNECIQNPRRDPLCKRGIRQ